MDDRYKCDLIMFGVGVAAGAIIDALAAPSFSQYIQGLLPFAVTFGSASALVSRTHIMVSDFAEQQLDLRKYKL